MPGWPKLFTFFVGEAVEKKDKPSEEKQKNPRLNSEQRPFQRNNLSGAGVLDMQRPAKPLQ